MKLNRQISKTMRLHTRRITAMPTDVRVVRSVIALAAMALTIHMSPILFGVLMSILAISVQSLEDMWIPGTGTLMTIMAVWYVILYTVIGSVAHIFI